MPEHDPGPPHVASGAAPSAHPAIHHLGHAAEHLHRAAHKLEKAVAQHEMRAHGSAGELSKEANGHIGEATAHLREAERLHHAYEQAH